MIQQGAAIDEIMFGSADAETLAYEHSLDIAEAAHRALGRAGITQKELAERMGKKPSQVCRMMSAQSNLTLKSIAELESALDTSLISIPPADQTPEKTGPSWSLTVVPGGASHLSGGAFPAPTLRLATLKEV